jgi:hypothetical protein
MFVEFLIDEYERKAPEQEEENEDLERNQIN